MIEWITVEWDDETIPDDGKEVVAMSPTGAAYITSWRPAYNIFFCQGKSEDAYGWKWAYLT